MVTAEVRKSSYIIALLLLVCPLFTIGQQQYLFMDRFMHGDYDQALNAEQSTFHTAVKPYLMAELKAVEGLDSIHYFSRMAEGIWRPSQIYVKPLLDLNGGVDLVDDTDSKAKYGLAGGVSLGANIGSQLSVRANYLYQQVNRTDWVNNRIETWSVLPGYGYAESTGSAFNHHHFSGYVSYSPSDIFNIQAGRGQNFWGDGYRSNFLMDNADSHPYLKISTNVWKIKYVNLFGAYKDISLNPAEPGQYRNKYMTSHFLSWNATKRLNLTFFETVVWQSEDSERQRGYDVHYLNPVIFYRPIEFSQGSSDNSIIGAGWKVKINDNNYIYGQIVFDEFLIRTIRQDIKQFFSPNDTTITDVGWWANKWAFQLGGKAHDLFGVEGLMLQTEVNMVRPYTYAHGSPQQNYGHANTPLAHPYGANFYEWITIGQYRHKNWLFEQLIQTGTYGEDPGFGVNYGGNIFLDYTDRVRTYDNFIGQGYQFKSVILRSTAGYNIKKYGLRAEAGFWFRTSYSDFERNTSALFFVGVKTPFRNSYTDY